MVLQFENNGLEWFEFHYNGQNLICFTLAELIKQTYYIYNINLLTLLN